MAKTISKIVICSPIRVRTEELRGELKKNLHFLKCGILNILPIKTQIPRVFLQSLRYRRIEERRVLLNISTLPDHYGAFHAANSHH